MHTPLVVAAIWAEVSWVSKFDSGRFSGTRGPRDDGFRKVNGFSTKVHPGRQGKHISGHKNCVLGKSVLHPSLSEIQLLVERCAGAGEWKCGNKEVVDFHRVIGTWVSVNDGNRFETTRGIIHYSKDGCQVVPTRPGKERDR